MGGHLECPHCDASFHSEQQRAAHLWYKHRVKTPIRKYIGDISICPCCSTDFHTRARLIRHLVTNLSKSKHKATLSCQQVFLGSSPEPIPSDEFTRLEERDKQVARVFRKKGHLQELAVVPCIRAKRKAKTAIHPVHRPQADYFWLPKRRIKRKMSQLEAEGPGSNKPRKRLRTKTPAHLACGTGM